MSVSFRVTSEGALAIERKLAGLVKAFGNLEPLMEGFGLYLESATIDRFENERGPDGQRWKPSLRARQQGGKTLTDRAQLRSSITSQAGPESVEVGTNKIYGGIHQFGGTIRAKNGEYLTFRLPGGLGVRRVKSVTMPARPFLGLSSEDENELLALTADYTRQQLGDGA
ncbi:phage virion morphogenesis protein [Novosphingobium sp. NDB2Meth1]|uniref:phage virion morphogenesis protein n=1 Tax=Novosphingobium sp. NDB2Meth1 TaxID=1892847 RepID=UPI0009F96441|nr:phage virion morphogenesis protein [Novosphingobium sp. NDB2Meth1]